MSNKLRTALLASLMTLLVAVPAAVWAGHTFDDVPSSNLFHDDITWLADAGVTRGCNPPDNTEFCPDDNVTREQMAAFMRRLAENQVVDADTVDGNDASSFLGVDEQAADADTVDGQHASALAAADHRHADLFASDVGGSSTSSTIYEDTGNAVQLTVPSGHTGVVVAEFSAESLCTTSNGGSQCAVRILVDGIQMGPGGDPTFDTASGGDGGESHAIHQVSNELSAGTYTVHVEHKVDDIDVNFDLFNALLTAEVKLTS